MDRSICKECSLTLPSFNGMCKIKLNNNSSFGEYAVVDDPVVVVASAKSFSKAVTELRRVRGGGLMVLSDLMSMLQPEMLASMCYLSLVSIVKCALILDLFCSLWILIILKNHALAALPVVYLVVYSNVM
mgnify:FL=1